MAKKKEMSRTSGTARRKISQAEQVRYGMKTGAPLTGSASGVKSISLKQAGEVLTQGIVTLGKKGLQMDPVSLAFALPIGKLGKAAGVLRSAGKVEKAAALEARIGAKTAGKIFGGSERGLPMERAVDVGGRARAASESVFPRAKFGTVDSIPNLTAEKARSAARSLGQAASKEIGTARALRNVPGEKMRSLNLFKESVANQRLGKALKNTVRRGK